MTISFHISSRTLFFAALLFVCPLVASAQSTVSKLEKLLRSDAAFQDSDFAALEKGETVVRSLKSKEKREVSIYGVIKLRNVPEISLTELVEKLSQKENKTVIGYGLFGRPPVQDDLRALALEDRDLDDMRKCEVGDCDLKLSAAMIRRLQSEVDWDAPDYRLRATQLFRQMLAEYVNDYLRRGDDALLQYDNRKTPVKLSDDHRMLLEGMLFMDEVSPEFGKYLRKFPSVELTGVENTLDWTKVDFGLKPIVTITHTASISFKDNNIPQFLIATKGIYASRYVDSSMALVILVRESVNNATNAYLVFTNISRSSSLSGLFGGFKRSIVSADSEGRVKEMLLESRAKLEQAAKATIPTSPPVVENGSSRYFRNPVVLAAAVLIAGLAVYFLLRRRKP